MSKKRNKVCGIDVHKRFLVASILDNEGNCETKRFEQDLDELILLKNWILDSGCESAAMESTAEYWRPAYGILNPEINITIGNAYHLHSRRLITRQAVPPLDHNTTVLAFQRSLPL